MSKSPVKTITYVCTQCKGSRAIKINRDYHIAKSIGGITPYHDYHICKNGEFIPSILSVDRSFVVRGQRSWLEMGKSKIPTPTIVNNSQDLKDPEAFNQVFSFIIVKSELLHMEFKYGSKLENSITQISPSQVYQITYALTENYQKFDGWVEERFSQALYALDVGQTINNDIISIMVSFIAEHADLKPDYVDQEIIIDLTKAEKIWMKWSSAFTPTYVDRHVPNMLGPGGVNIAQKIIPYMDTGENTHYAISEKSGIDLASTVSIAFMLELWGVLEYVYKD